jgi:hypothetical protein
MLQQLPVIGRIQKVSEQDVCETSVLCPPMSLCYDTSLNLANTNSRQSYEGLPYLEPVSCDLFPELQAHGTIGVREGQVAFVVKPIRGSDREISLEAQAAHGTEDDATITRRSIHGHRQLRT